VNVQQHWSPAHPSAWEINLWHSSRSKIDGQLFDKRNGKLGEFGV
jgi:hypothetical protein